MQKSRTATRHGSPLFTKLNTDRPQEAEGGPRHDGAARESGRRGPDHELDPDFLGDAGGGAVGLQRPVLRLTGLDRALR